MGSIEKGSLSLECFRGLVALTDLRSEKVIKALEAHLVEGLTQPECESKLGVRQSLISRGVSSISKTQKIVMELCQHCCIDDAT